MPPDHARAVREHRPLSRAQRRLALIATTAVIALTTVVILLTTGGPPQLGCINTYLPGAMGAEALHECGSEARQTCATLHDSFRQYGQVGELIMERACRTGRLPVG
ncbi:hypothetical protein [Conexibacter sp. DBS9H8]|uniref:hypothetical protein n=1 Tax=Conexibacter sp. DBS9H8 TaxID=2937801 RepID=UPI00200D8871|nr:hypothetical protein [Conexibacter sp. DBS9H8]